jgi:hypothetical protein
MKKMGVIKMAVVSVEYGTLAIKVGLVFFLIAIFLVFPFYIRCSKLLHLPPLSLQCVGGCRDRNQDCCDFGNDNHTL